MYNRPIMKAADIRDKVKLSLNDPSEGRSSFGNDEAETLPG